MHYLQWFTSPLLKYNAYTVDYVLYLAGRDLTFRICVALRVFPSAPQNYLCPFLAQGLQTTFKNDDEGIVSVLFLCHCSLRFVCITSSGFTPPCSCLFSCPSPLDIWLTSICVVRHPRNAEGKRNLKHGFFVCSSEPPVWPCDSQGTVNFYCDMLASGTPRIEIGTQCIFKNSESFFWMKTKSTNWN